MFLKRLFLFLRLQTPCGVLGLHVADDGLWAAWLTGDAWQARMAVTLRHWSGSEVGTVDLSDPAMRDALLAPLARSGVRASVLAVVLEDSAFLRETLPALDEADDRDGGDALAEWLTRHPGLGDEPRCVWDVAGQVWALPQARWQAWQAMAQSLGMALELIGHADAARALARSHPLGQSAPAQAVAARLEAGAGDAALGAALGAWHGLQPQWWPEGPHRRRRRWHDIARHTVRAIALGVTLGLLAWGGESVGEVWLAASSTAGPSLTELAQEAPGWQQASAQWQQRIQQAQQEQRRVEAAQGERRANARVWQATVGLPGVWLSAMSRQGPDWVWQGEADSPRAAQQVLHALTLSRPWRQAPHVTQGEWQTSRHAAASVWAFRIQAQSEGP